MECKQTTLQARQKDTIHLLTSIHSIVEATLFPS